MRIDALYTQAMALDRLHREDEAFDKFSEANAQERLETLKEDIDPSCFRASVELAHKRLDLGWSNIAPMEADSSGHRPPVFFVGFPRSGTTLFEQMLTKHPQVATTNEDSPLAKVAETVDLSRSFVNISVHERHRLRALFWQQAGAVVGSLEGQQLVDKMPLNIEYLDLALCLFPQAKVVLSMRDPRDVCLSCFMQHFARSYAMANFQELSETAQVYDRIMGLWQKQKELLPMSWKEFRYEDLVEDMEKTISPILTFMDLAWVDEIKEYRDYSFQERVITPSYSQIGEPLHNRASGRWERYESHLAPIMETLEPYLRLYGYAK